MFEITKFDMINKGALIAKFDICVIKWGRYILAECKYFESNGKKWVTPPSRECEIDGKKKFVKLNYFQDKEIQDKFMGCILKFVEEHIAKMAIETKEKTREEKFDEMIPF